MSTPRHALIKSRVKIVNSLLKRRKSIQKRNVSLKAKIFAARMLSNENLSSKLTPAINTVIKGSNLFEFTLKKGDDQAQKESHLKQPTSLPN